MNFEDFIWTIIFTVVIALVILGIFTPSAEPAESQLCFEWHLPTLNADGSALIDLDKIILNINNESIFLPVTTNYCKNLKPGVYSATLQAGDTSGNLSKKSKRKIFRHKISLFRPGPFQFFKGNS